MKNLSENQTKVIESIISEFEKINAIKSSNSNKLFDVNIIVNNIEKETNLISEIIINNRYMIDIYNSKIKEDTEKLNDSLNVLGIKAVQIELGIIICRIDGNKSDNNFVIRYNSESTFVSINPSKSKRKIGKLNNLSCYLSRSYREDFFDSIESICETNYFAQKIKRLFN